LAIRAPGHRLAAILTSHLQLATARRPEGPHRALDHPSDARQGGLTSPAMRPGLGLSEPVGGTSIGAPSRPCAPRTR